MWKYLAIRRTPILALTCHPKTDFSWENRAPYNRITTVAYFRYTKFRFLWIELLSYFSASIQKSSQDLISICLIFTMYQEIIHYNLHRNPFKEFVHLPLVDLRDRRDAKRESCKLISTPGGIECEELWAFIIHWELPVSTASIKGNETLCTR